MSHKYSYLYQVISANGFPPAALQTKVTVWPKRIVSPSMYPVISGGPGGSAIYKLAITHLNGASTTRCMKFGAIHNFIYASRPKLSQQQQKKFPFQGNVLIKRYYQLDLYVFAARPTPDGLRDPSKNTVVD